MSLEQQAPEAAHWSRQQYDAIFFSSGPSRQAIVVETDGLQGFLVARADGGEWEIENIAVAGNARRRGIAGQLLDELMDRARKEGATAIFLEVRESNRAARALYRKWGFREDGRRKNYYREPEEDAMLYRFSFL